MENSEKCRLEAKELEQRLKAEGRHADQRIIQRLRKVAASTTGTLKTIHRDNMELRAEIKRLKGE